MRTSHGGRWTLLGAAALIAPLLQTTLAPAASAADEPPVTIRVAHLSQTGQVPPAVVAGGAAGDAYDVRDDGGAEVLGGVLTPLTARPADAWASFGLADLSGLAAGTYTVESDGATSVPFTVSDSADDDVVTSLLPVYDANADGTEPSSFHDPSHLNDASSPIANGPHKGKHIDVEGGWMDAGDMLKFTITIAYSTLMLDLAARNDPAVAPELRHTAGIGIRWLLKAHPANGIFVSQVGDVAADHDAPWRDPASDDSSPDPLLRNRPTYVLTGTTGGADVAAMAAAALATRASLTEPGATRTALVKAAKAWLAEAGQLHKPWHNCCYPGETFQDDIAVAKAALWRATGSASYATGAGSALKTATKNGARNWLVSADGFEMSGIASADLCGVLGAPAAPAAVKKIACPILRSGGYAWQSVVDGDTAFGRAGWNQWGSIRQNESSALVLELARRAGNTDVAPVLARATGWFLGVNPWGYRWETDVDGSVPGGITTPYHWTSELGHEPPSGAVPGGPTTLETINGNRCFDCPPLTLGTYDTAQQVYQEDPEDWVMNEIGISYNAPAVLHFALLAPQG